MGADTQSPGHDVLASVQATEILVQADREWPAQARRVVRRQRVFLVVAVVAALASVAGLMASTLVKSPAQRAAEQAPPAASVLTATVQEKVLSSVVAVRGAVSADTTVAVSASGAVRSGSVLAVTASPKKAGDVVAAGDVVSEISGRPVLALPGVIPAYRDLTPGMSGQDVVQLQNALKALGFADDDVSGDFGRGTQRAVKQLYESRGCAALTTTDVLGAAETDTLQSARATERTAKRAVRDATAAVDAALDEVAAATARQQLADAKVDLTDASSARSALEANIGVMVPLGEVVYVPTMPASVGTIGAAVGTVLSGADSAVMTLLTGQLSVRAMLVEGQQQLVAVGLPVTITDDVHSRTAQGTVASVGAYTGADASQTSTGAQVSTTTTNTATSGYPLVITLTTALDVSWLGADVLIQVVAASTTDAVLVVPATAITTHADGTTSVQVLSADRTRREVPVTTGAIANGEVQVAPTTTGVLSVDDEVVVGVS